MNSTDRFSARALLNLMTAISLMFALVMVPTGLVFAGDAGETKIVAINTSEILEAHPAFQEAREKFETELKGMQQQLENMDEAQQQAAQQQMQQNVQQRGEELQQEAFEKLQKDIERIAEEKGYDYVIDSNLLIAGGKDVTQEFMKALDLEKQKPEKQKQ